MHDSLNSNSELCSAAAEMGEGKYSVQVTTNVGAVEAHRPVWGKWTICLNSDIDYYLYRLGHDPTILSPYVITVYKDGIAQAMLV